MVAVKRSNNQQLTDIKHMPNGYSRAQCSAAIRKLYERKERRPGALFSSVSAGLLTDGRRAWATEATDRYFGTADAEYGLHAEPYLRRSVYRWLLSSCRSRPSIRAYVGVLWSFSKATDKRSLSAHTDTSEEQIGNYLFAMESEGRAQRTTMLHLSVLRSWMRWLFDQDLIRRIPITRSLIRSFRVDRRRVCKADGSRQALSQTEAQRVVDWALQQASPEAGLSVMLQIVGGLRSDEVARLKRAHIVEREGKVTCTIMGKGNKSRQITLEPVVIAAWRRYLTARRRQGTRGPMIERPGGGHYSTRQVQRWAKDAAAVVGRTLEISSHDLRKTSATILMERGAELHEVQGHLGHSNPALTQACYVVRGQPMDTTTGLHAPTPVDAEIDKAHGTMVAHFLAARAATPSRVLPGAPDAQGGGAPDIDVAKRTAKNSEIAKNQKMTDLSPPGRPVTPW